LGKFKLTPSPGPIIRISPYELHINEPDYYDELYSFSKPRKKYAWMLAPFSLPGATFSIIDHKHHHMRRAAMAPFFSKQSVNRLEPMLSYMVEKLCKRIEEFRASGQPVPIRSLYMCLTTDLITFVCFE
jgi:cytochrome P450